MTSNSNDKANNNPNIIFSIKDTNLYVPVVPKEIIKNCNVIINRKNFYDQAIDSDTKRQEQTRKIANGQGEEYITGCLSDYDYIKNHYRLIVVDLSRQKELDGDPKAVQSIEFAGQLKKLNANYNDAEAGNVQSTFILTILEKFKEQRKTFSQGSVAVL